MQAGTGTTVAGHARRWCAGLAVLCLYATSSWAQESQPATPDEAINGMANSSLALPGGSILAASNSRPARQQLELRLGGPLGVQSWGATQAASQQNAGLVLAGSSLNYQLDEKLSLAGGATLSEQGAGFQALGSIHCENGILDAASYRASNCHFVDDLSTIRSGTLSIGGRYQVSESASASLNLFQLRQDAGNPYQPGNDSRMAAANLDPFSTRGAAGGWPYSLFNAGASMQNLDAQLTGIDMQFQVGLSTDQSGDMVLGLQLTRVLDSEIEGAYYSLPGIQNWTLAKPFDSARLSLDWNRGAFSGGVQTYYRSAVEFLNRNSLDEQATFDVHFTWRAPWNASVSVGASNVLNAGTDNTGPVDGQLTDPFESIYGRIPYVRYKQDL